MGEVYRATDTKLGRDVALKVLPAEMAQDAERLGRFRREAKVLAQLDRPNIVTIYSEEEFEGVHFLTMQLVEGLPLFAILRRRSLTCAPICCWGSYRLGKYEETLEALARANMPNHFHVPAIQAAVGQLGRLDEARKAVQKLLALRPDFAAVARQEYGKWYDEEHVEQVIEGLRKAGLEIV
jgi:tetratricopeptide (TPR) repeat protein